MQGDVAGDAEPSGPPESTTSDAGDSAECKDDDQHSGPPPGSVPADGGGDGKVDPEPEETPHGMADDVCFAVDFLKMV